MPSRRDIRKSFKFLLYSRATRSISMAFLTVALPLYLVVLHYTLTQIAIIYLLLTIANIIVSFYMGVLGDKIGYKNAMIIANLLPLLSLTILCLSSNTLIIAIAAIIGGIGGVTGSTRGPYYMVQNAMVSHNWPSEEDRIHRMAILSAFTSFFAVVGSALLILKGYAASLYGSAFLFQVFFGLCAVILTISIMSVAFVREVKRPKKHNKLMTSSSFSSTIRTIYASVLSSTSAGMVLPLVSLLLATRYHATTSYIGIVLSLSLLAATIGAIMASRNVYKHTAKHNIKISAVTLMLQGIFFILMAFSSTIQYAAMFFILEYFFAGIGEPYQFAISTRGVDKQDYGASSSMQGVATNASMTSSSISAYIMDAAPTMPLFAGGIMQLIGSAVYFKLLKGTEEDA